MIWRESACAASEETLLLSRAVYIPSSNSEFEGAADPEGDWPPAAISRMTREEEVGGEVSGAMMDGGGSEGEPPGSAGGPRCAIWWDPVLGAQGLG